MSERKTVEALISGGKATGGPPLGPALGPLGVNVHAIVTKINTMTENYSGMKVPVKIVIDLETKDFEIEVGIPTTSALIVSELNVEKGSSTPKSQSIGSLSMPQIIKIAKIKSPNLLANDLKAAVKEVLGSCVSMGVLAGDKSPKEVQKEIDSGIYDELLESVKV